MSISAVTPEQLKLIERLYKELRQLEVRLAERQLGKDDSITDELDLRKVLDCFEQIESSFLQSKDLARNLLIDLINDLPKDLQKILEVKKHLHSKMTAQSLACQIVPIERYLAKNLKDSDILVSTEDLTQPISPSIPLILALDNIRSSFNVGSIFRIADCVRLEKIFLCGYSPSPASTPGVAKTAMGADEFVTWDSSPNIRHLLPELKAQGFRCVAFETSAQAQSLFAPFDSKLVSKTVFIFGNERFGLDPDVLQMVDEIRQIPLSGYKNSLNVATSVAISVFEWRRQYEQS